MANKYLTDDELISTINHSSDPYIVVEGPDDTMIYRWILEDINCEAFLEPRGGCDGVKGLYLRRNEITNPKVVFICDKDTFVYTEIIPEKYNGIIFTEGYSIENDLYKGRSIEKKYFKKKDNEIFSTALTSFLKAYACELEKFKNSVKYDFTINPESIIDKNDYSLKSKDLVNYTEPTDETVDYLTNNYELLLRGHSLFSLLRIVLGRKNREIKYSIKQIYEICYANKSESINNMQNKIKTSLHLSPTHL